MGEQDDIVKVFDIDPSPAPSYTLLSTYLISPNVTDVRFGGWTDTTYLFVLPQGPTTAKFGINYATLEELDGVIYDVHTVTTMSPFGLPPRVPRVTSEDVRVFVWNYRGTARASFRPNLFTIMSMIGCQVVVLTDTSVAGWNSRRLLNEDTSKVVVTGHTRENDFVAFYIKVN
ncbi:hypothetical protein Cgig2_033818 [Carnegiea gigantea]|uniref:Uncharacterized protein n=1 Tax=Carnegiea gigantea TaxID=171969 RepID=A0A9Q1Q662_9CARY|nr:hypothetical protein Cgig2_033818 [Carnegiea gigantea]